MKKVRVNLEVVMEVPDDWGPAEPNEDVGVHLKAGDAMLQPEFIWVQYIGGNAEEGYNWDYIADELDDQMDEMVVDGTVTISEM